MIHRRSTPRPALLALRLLLAALPLSLYAAAAHADAARAPDADPAPQSRPWSAADPRIAADLQAGRPLVTFVVVPLCDNAQINCGAAFAGRPGDLEKNLYWGAVFGQRRFFERKGSGWTRVERAAGADPLLERAVYRRAAPRAAWGGGEGEIEQIVILQAVHGAAIDRAMDLFWQLATAGGEIRFEDGGVQRAERIHVVGYAGHNRLMDGLRLPAAPAALPRGAAPIPSFVMACMSDGYFSASLRRAGSEPLVMTRALMAPEGYVIDAIARALGENAPAAEVRERAVLAYASWQRLSPGVASTIFARSR